MFEINNKKHTSIPRVCALTIEKVFFLVEKGDID